MSGWNMTGVNNPEEEKINKAIKAAQDLAFDRTPFNGKVRNLNDGKPSIGDSNEKNVKPQEEEKVLTPPKYKFSYFTEAQISLAVTKGEDLSEEQVNYLRDKVDFYKYFAKEFNIPNPTTAKAINMVADSGVLVLSDDTIKKAFDYKDRDGSEISKNTERFSRDEQFLMSKEIVCYYNRGEKGKVVRDLFNHMYNTAYGIKTEKTPEQIAAKEKLDANVNKAYERIVNKGLLDGTPELSAGADFEQILNSQKEGQERSGSMKR